MCFFTEAYNVDPQLCCGHLGSEKILHKESNDSICCGDGQYNPKTHCCCGDLLLRIETQKCSKCCEEDENQAPSCMSSSLRLSEAYNVDRQLCCGDLGSEKILHKESNDSICCGDGQYNPKTHCCCGDLLLRIETQKCSKCCEEDENQAPSCMSSSLRLSEAYYVDRQLCCGDLGSEKILHKESNDSICCGDGQYNPKTHCCCGDLLLRIETRKCSKCCEEDENQAPSCMLSSLRLSEAYNVDRQLCCGDLGSEKILHKESNNSICCGDGQYNPKTHCCCGDLLLRIETQKCSKCCEEDENQAPSCMLSSLRLSGV
ncbi:Galaxin [Merluccius polli]|uniref:Galaxin n=1 Tax=Merluccius polli TaxID=89951 RepID=A0AA47P336_MERPO|nr:Galaxin [Merluccius polli]